MLKPNNYDNTKAFTGYDPLPAGNYVCRIMQVQETTSRNGRPMLLICLDIVRGDYRGFYTDEYKANIKQDKKWPCIVYQLTEDDQRNCSRGLKTFLEAVEASNMGFDINRYWGDGFCEALRNKIVGGKFRREQYESRTGELRWSTKCAGFCTADEVDELPTMNDKPLDRPQTPSYFTGAASDEYSNGKLPWDEE